MWLGCLVMWYGCYERLAWLCEGCVGWKWSEQSGILMCCAVVYMLRRSGSVVCSVRIWYGWLVAEG